MAKRSSPENLARDLAEERAKIDETIDEIQKRLSPGQLIDEVLRHGRGAGSDVVSSLGRTLTANPLPTALIGVGLLWLLLSPRPPEPQPDTSAKREPADAANYQI